GGPAGRAGPLDLSRTPERVRKGRRLCPAPACAGAAFATETRNLTHQNQAMCMPDPHQPASASWRNRMNNVTGAARALALAASLAAGAFVAAPSYAATDFDLLKQYIGDWRGRGVMTGAQKETVLCRMSLTQGNQEKVNYSGRCTLAGTTLSINGTVAYVAQNRRFEAAMTTNAGFTSMAAGQKRGDQIVFN